MDGRKPPHVDNQKQLVQNLLSEIYDRYRCEHLSSTETSCLSDHRLSDAVSVCGISATYSETLQELKKQQNQKVQRVYLKTKCLKELSAIIEEIEERITVVSAKLIRQLKLRSRLREKNQRFCDMLTAVLQAVSQKRRIDTKLQFSLEPPIGSEHGFSQWKDTLRAILRLPKGTPGPWRKKIWSVLSQHHFEIHHKEYDWNELSQYVFSEKFNPDDDYLDNQIVKDLHRTGYTMLTSENNEETKMKLKRVLLAYARWNKSVGYCQGFNVIAALILDVTYGDESLTLQIMIYLIDGVLPENYFTDNLRGLSVDMAVFRDLLKIRLPDLSRHLDSLQKQANADLKARHYEPPLTNVFTMQWFLTLYATCLPKSVVLRIWDSVLIDGNEILLRSALAIWAKLGEKIGIIQSADEFYCEMSVLTKELLQGKLIHADNLMRTVYHIAAFPFPRLEEFREKYTYNITPFVADEEGVTDWEKEKGYKHNMSQDSNTTSESEADNHYDGMRRKKKIYYEEEDDAPFTCFGGLSIAQAEALTYGDKNVDLVKASPGAFGSSSSNSKQDQNGMLTERMSTDISALKKQYMKIRSKQIKSSYFISAKATENTVSNSIQNSPVAINHLLIGHNQTKGAKSSQLNRQTLPWKDAVLIQKLKSPSRKKMDSKPSLPV